MTQVKRECETTCRCTSLSIRRGCLKSLHSTKACQLSRSNKTAQRLVNDDHCLPTSTLVTGTHYTGTLFLKVQYRVVVG